MYLVYINELGPDYKGEKIYEFIFSKDKDDIYGEDWDVSPASGKPSPPEMKFIQKVETVCDKDILLELVQNSDTFSFMDAMDDIIALGWESYDSDFVSDDEVKRLVFKFGEPYAQVTNKLSERSLNLKSVK